jgi:hypothetical protein
VHACPGNELAKLEMLVLIHHLVTGYRCVRISTYIDLSLYSVMSHVLVVPLHAFSNSNSLSGPSPPLFLARRLLTAMETAVE